MSLLKSILMKSSISQQVHVVMKTYNFSDVVYGTRSLLINPLGLQIIHSLCFASTIFVSTDVDFEVAVVFAKAP